MAAPSFVAASTGATDATGGWTATCHAPGAADRIIILQFLADGTNASYPTISSTTNIKDLAGTSGAWTRVTAAAGSDVGSAKSASQHIYIGRSASTSAPVVTGANAGGDDVYWRFYEFQDVSAGATLATVIENVTAGAIVSGAATSGTIADASVTTLGVDRLALNFIAINDDNAIASFTGGTGGTWAEAVAEYADAGGTDASIGLQISYLASDGVYWTPANELTVGSTTREKMAQPFTAVSSTLYAVGLYLRDTGGGPTDSLVLEIQTDSGGNPSGTSLGSAFISGETLTTISKWSEFVVDVSGLTPTSTYWIVVSRSGSLGADVYSIGTNTLYGTVCKTLDDGVWTAESSNFDFSLVPSSGSRTIDGGTATNSDATDGWGTVGFALIGTTVAASYGPPFTQNIPVRMRL